MDYHEFIQSKVRSAKPLGFDVDESDLPAGLKDWQATCVKWALNRGRAALFQDTGLGKTFQQLAWADAVCKRTGGRVVIHTPVGVRNQTQREAAKFAIDTPVAVVDDPSELIDGINLINYEKLHKFDSTIWDGVVLDECFPPDTMVDTALGQKRIDTIRVGDTIVNVCGFDTVNKTNRREVNYAVRIVCGGKEITASPNHPVFTQRGWVASQDLEPGDCLLSTTSAMRILRGDVYPTEVSSEWASEILREILFSELEDETAEILAECPQPASRGEEGEVNCGMVGGWQRGCDSSERTNRCHEPDDRSTYAKQDQPDIESNEPQTFRAWRKREGDDDCTIGIAECFGTWVGNRVQLIAGKTESQLSNALQTRLSERRAQSEYRSGWTLSSQSKRVGCETRCDGTFTRVDSIEVLELGHPDLDKLRDADGKLYFYDLGIERHPSFSVEGFLVHNSQILKNFTGATKQLLINSYANTRYRLACTATPAPNDHMELGNHADFLGVMPSNEMLSRWFINDTMKAGGYRLKKHAQKDFWRWVTSWAVCLSKPSDMGGDDTGYILPELSVCNHIVRVGYDCAADGFLFDCEGISATNIHKEKRRTNEERSKLAASLAESSDKPVLVWCYTDYESKELIKAIPGSVEVRGSMPDKKKQDMLFAFANGEIEILVTKPSIAGVGLNFQVCNTQIFASLSFSFQEYYQAVRRSWRFGQQRPVQVHIIGSEADANIEKSIARKGADHGLMQRSMAEVVKQFGLSNHTERMRERISSTDVPLMPDFLKPKAVEIYS